MCESPQEDEPERQLTNKVRLLDDLGRALQAEGTAGVSARDGRELGWLREDQRGWKGAGREGQRRWQEKPLGATARGLQFILGPRESSGRCSAGKGETRAPGFERRSMEDGELRPGRVRVERPVRHPNGDVTWGLAFTQEIRT